MNRLERFLLAAIIAGILAFAVAFSVKHGERIAGYHPDPRLWWLSDPDYPQHARTQCNRPGKPIRAAGLTSRGGRITFVDHTGWVLPNRKPDGWTAEYRYNAILCAVA